MAQKIRKIPLDLFPSFRLPFFLLLLCHPSLLIFGQARVFEWTVSNQLSSGENWVGGKGPCEGDIGRMGTEEAADEGIELAMLQGALGVSKLELPENGILYFGENAEMGEKPAQWQCPKHASGPEDALFRPKIASPNFFDSANWQIKTENGKGKYGQGLVQLDAERVPSSEDVVVLPAQSASKIFMDVPARLRQFNISPLSLSNDQLRQLPFTVEGQFLVRIGPRLGVDFQLDDRYQFKWPTEPVFTLEPEKSEGERQKSVLFGRANSNFFEPQFSALCQFVRCEPVEPYCLEPVKPLGQCCEQCGALMQFRQNSLNFTRSRDAINWFRPNLAPSGAGISFVRIDKSDYHPLYQLAVLGSHPSMFHESDYCSTMWLAFKMVQQMNSPAKGESYFGIESKCSQQKSLIRLGQVLRISILILAFAAILAFAFRTEYRRNARLRLFLANLRTAATNAGVSVHWQRSTERVEIAHREQCESETSQLAPPSGGGFLEFVNQAFLRPTSAVEDKEVEADDTGKKAQLTEVGMEKELMENIPDEEQSSEGRGEEEGGFDQKIFEAE